MVLQVAAHGWRVTNHVDPVLLQVGCRTDAGYHHDLGRIERTGRQDHAAPRSQDLAPPALPDRDACDLAAFDDQLVDQRLRADFKVGHIPQRLDIGTRGRPAFTIALRHLINPETILTLAVEILIQPQLQRFRARYKSLAGRVHPFLVGNEQRTFTAMEIVRAAFVAFGIFEKRQDIIIAPAIAAEFSPIVVIPLVTANIDHRIDGR